MTKIYDATHHILIHTGYVNPAEHRHMAAHILFSLSGSLSVTSAGTEYRCHGVMIPSGVPHQVDTNGSNALVFLYDCTTDTARQIRTIQGIPETTCRQIIAAYSALTAQPDDYLLFEQFLLEQCGITGSVCGMTDPRIRSAMEYIRAQISRPIRCREVAEAVHLSQSRFSHLFKQQTGMTFAAYWIYQKIMSVYTGMVRGSSITDAALDAGFSSSAHFADVHRRLFGIPASRITQDMTFFKV